MLLSEAPQGATVAVSHIADSALSVRLQELGIRPGYPLTVMQRGGGDAMIVGVGEQRIALALEIAATISTDSSTAR
jgi:Fe2+ transport system protein FeoA